MRLNKNKLELVFGRLVNSCLFVIIFLLVQPAVLAQDDEAVNFKEYKGVIVDEKTQKALEYASISVSNSNISTISNLEGVFLIKVPTGLENENVYEIGRVQGQRPGEVLRLKL